MIVFGPLSSVSDILTFLTLRLGFHASATLSRSGWLIESTIIIIIELAVMLVPGISRPFYQSQPRPGSAAVIGRHRRHHDHQARPSSTRARE